MANERVLDLPENVTASATSQRGVGTQASGASVHADHQAARRRAEAAWRATTPALAAASRLRISADGGRSYPRHRERDLPVAPPDQPAAVRIYDQHGLARCLPADLDSSRGGPQQVALDLARLQQLLRRCGARTITDRSPNGGVHLYVPWQHPVPFTELRPVMLALAGLLPTLDVQPAVNVLSGCLRPPGSRHKTGGWQELLTPLSEARAIAATGNPPQVWARLRALLLPQPTQSRTDVNSAQVAPDAPTGGSRPIDVALPHGAAGSAGPHERRAHLEQLPLPRRRLSADTLQIARHGLYDPDRYPTPSQARQRVVAAAAGAGWTYADLLEQLHSGQWPGLASFYSRYPTRHRPERVAADWSAAITWLRQQKPGKRAEQQQTHNSHTREPATHGGAPPTESDTTPGPRSTLGRKRASSAEYQYVRSWWNAALRLERSRYPGRQGLTRRLLLRALANAAQKKGSRYLEFGCRSLALAMGVDHSTAAAALRLLRSEADPLLVLLENKRGVLGDLYELVIPDQVRDTIERRPWKAGSIQAIHPVFRGLGLPVAFVYEQLETASRNSFDLAEAALVSQRAAQQALHTLSTHGLATRTATGWSRGTRTLNSVAAALGIDVIVEQVQARYRQQRQAWRALLGAYLAPPLGQQRAEPPPPPRTKESGLACEPPPEWLESPLQLLHRVLGAVPIPADDPMRDSGPQSGTRLVPSSRT